MRAFFTTFAVGGVLLCGTASWAATLEPVQGDLWINHGKGFEKVNSRMDAKIGDSVMVNPGGIAKVTYPDGCQANVKPEAVMTIARLSPCASGSLAADLTPVYKAPVGAPAEAPAAAPFVWWPWVALAGAGAGIGFLISESGGGCTQTLYEGCH